MKRLILLRGPSGSGKSTIAKTIGGKIFETDKFWERSGAYKFDPSKLGLAHAWNQANVKTACNFGEELVVVANTNMTMWEMKPYLAVAAENGYELEVIRTPGPWDPDVLFERNVHGVPLGTLQKQVRKYQEHDEETEWTDMSIFKNEQRTQS
jgi:predicted kinase